MPDTILNKLWNNWMFRLSLSSNELFHSNFLQLVLSDSSPDAIDDRSGLTSWARVWELARWAGLDPQWIDDRHKDYGHCHVFVYREWKQLDLAIVAREQSAKGKYRDIVIFAVELKIKSYPRIEQVRGYLADMSKHNGDAAFTPRLVLLSLARPPAGFGDVPDLSVMDFSQLANGIEGLGPECTLAPAVAEYAALCRLLNALSLHWETLLQPALTLKDVTGAHRVYQRLNPIWSKLCAAYLCTLVAEKMQGVVHDDFELQAVPGFSNAHWSADFLWCAPAHAGHESALPKRPANVVAKVGVQIEGDTIRFMLNALHVGDQDNTARQIVEQALLRQGETHGLFARLHQLYSLSAATAPAGIPGEVQEFWRRYPRIRRRANGLPRLSSPAAASGFRLTGYENGPRFGHADYRLKLDPEVTLDELSMLVVDALKGDFNEHGRHAFHCVLTEPAAFAHPLA